MVRLAGPEAGVKRGLEKRSKEIWKKMEHDRAR